MTSKSNREIRLSKDYKAIYFQLWPIIDAKGPVYCGERLLKEIL